MDQQIEAKQKWVRASEMDFASAAEALEHAKRLKQVQFSSSRLQVEHAEYSRRYVVMVLR